MSLSKTVLGYPKVDAVTKPLHHWDFALQLADTATPKTLTPEPKQYYSFMLIAELLVP